MSIDKYHIVQFNFARIRAPIDDPIVAGFVSQLDAINSLADVSPGFVWRVQTEKGHSLDIRPYEDPSLLITFSVWESIESLYDFVYQGQHAVVMRDRRKWFEHLEGFYIVLWWVPAGYIPSMEEALERMGHLQCHGPTPYAFTFEKRFPPTALAQSKGDVKVGAVAEHRD